MKGKIKMETTIFFEVYFNVWNCEAKLRVELWQGNEYSSKLIEGIYIPCTQTEIKKNVERINMSGRYPATRLNKKTIELVNKAIKDLTNKHK
jgi:hypothetical protein